jgi:alpha,alpha-trehalase
MVPSSAATWAGHGQAESRLAAGLDHEGCDRQIDRDDPVSALPRFSSKAMMITLIPLRTCTGSGRRCHRSELARALLRFAIAIVAAATLLSCRAGPVNEPGPVLREAPTPAELYGELYRVVQLSRVYPDGKTFADARSVRPPDQVLAAYRSAIRRPGFRLERFLAENFRLDAALPDLDSAQGGHAVADHIDRLWRVLERPPDTMAEYSSQIALPYPYVVPGGRFRELYYWDSYFTMLGLRESGRRDLLVAMVNNFAWLITQYGHVPNGSRTYYVSRSQPPFFAMMLELLAESDGPSVYARYLPQLQREHAFWMAGSAALARGHAHRRVVRLPDGALLNRYWDDKATPRDESYLEDVETARASRRPVDVVYRELRAAAESGWDFSSRWLADGAKLTTIHTTDFVSPDLNSLLFRLELAIAQGCAQLSDLRCAREMQTRASERKQAMADHLWSDELGAFADYDFRAARHSPVLSAATLYPLFVGACNEDQARQVAQTTRTRLLRDHGVVTTENVSGQQWDAPNGWAPLQWIAVIGLRAHGEHETAHDIAARWIAANLALYRREGRFVEKYDVESAVAGTGGEYPAQDGFGWTNGVLRKLLVMYPASSAGRAEP